MFDFLKFLMSEWMELVVSEWMWFVAIILALVLAYTGFTKWVDASVKIERILREELHDDDAENNSEDR